MEKQYGVSAMRIPAAPDASRANELLQMIADRPCRTGPRRVDKPLALYGAGNLGKMAADYFQHLGIKISFVVDTAAHICGRDPFWVDTKLLSPGEVSIEERERVILAVCIATSPFSEIADDLVSDGWRDVVPFYDIAEAYRDRHPLGNGWFVGECNAIDLQAIAAVLTCWNDDVSRAHHLQFIAWHRLREDWFFDDAPINANDRYFIPQVLCALHDHEIFVDVGAHHGEVIKKFITVVSNRFTAIRAIEPDAESLIQLRKQLELPGFSREAVNILPYALGEKNARATFYNGLGYSSQLSAIGLNDVDVMTIDGLGISPTFLKLHLEGWELDALKGAAETLKQCRPIVAVTAYHSNQGLWQLPKWLMDNLVNYIFLLRLHNWCGTGLVIYAIPEERT